MLALACWLAAPALAAAQTVVSLEFDDGTSDQTQAGAMLASQAMAATFFIISGRVGVPGYMSLGQLQALAAAGDEIGGHTITHTRLTALTPSQATQEICGGRAALQADGFAVSDFAYPYGDYNATLEQTVASCGFDSAREAGGLRVPSGCSPCATAETIPPRNPYATRTPGSVQLGDPLSEIEGLVAQAEANGSGWVQLVFHHLCATACRYPYSTTTAEFSALLDWLKTRQAACSVTVKTVHQVMRGDNTPPVVALTGPLGGLVVGNSATLQANASDPAGVSQVAFLVDGHVVGVATAPPYEVSWSAAGSTRAQVTACATDASGNLASSAPMTLTVDARPPSAPVLRRPGARLRGAVTLALRRAPSGGEPLAAVTYSFRRRGGQWRTACTSRHTPWSCRWSALVPNGAYGLRASATDALGASAVSRPLAVAVVNPLLAARALSSTGVSGELRRGDEIIFRYSKRLNPGSLLTGFTGRRIRVRVRVRGGRSVLSVWSADGRRRVWLGSVVLGGRYIASRSVLFSAVMSARGSVVTVRLQRRFAGTVARASVGGGRLRWTPSVLATDLTGNAVRARAVSAPGPAFARAR